MLLKAAAPMVAAFLSVLTQGLADTLLTGAIRDRAGAVIDGAKVTAFDATGRTVGSDVARADGTFAIAALAAPASIAISCDYCPPVRRSIDPTVPIVVIVDRYAAVTASGPAQADIRALPYRDAADIASLRPFTVESGGRISELGLDRSAAVLVDGLPFYRPADGSDLDQLVPAHATAALDVASPLFAPQYGGYSDAGIYDVRLRDPDAATSRFDAGDASDLIVRADGPSAAAGAAASSDTRDDRQAAYAGASAPFAGGRISGDALAMSDPFSHAAGAGLAYGTDSRRFTTDAALDATQSDGSSLVQANLNVRNRGPLGLEFGVRTMRATSSLGDDAGVQFDAAAYARATRRTDASDLSATVAVDRGSDAGLASGLQSTAIVGSLDDDVRLGSRWSARSGVVSNLRIPTFAEVSAAAPAVIAGDRSLLFEQSVTYEDLRRVRIAALTFAERVTGFATQHENGVGIDAAWQIAPPLSLRSWLLRANRSTIAGQYSAATYDAADAPSQAASSLTRQLIWLSYDRYVRLDAVVRGAGFEGDVRVPVSTTYALAIGTAQNRGRRIVTFGVTRL